VRRQNSEVRSAAVAVIRPEVVGLLVQGVAGRMDGAEFAAVVDQASADEQRSAARVLARAAVEGPSDEPPGLLSLSYREVTHLGLQGVALMWLADQLAPSWAAHPDEPMGNVLKVIPADRLAYLRAELARVGLDLGGEQ
jgi:hypothetical protein